jgi:hypothetical protein
MRDAIGNHLNQCLEGSRPRDPLFSSRARLVRLIIANAITAREDARLPYQPIPSH